MANWTILGMSDVSFSEEQNPKNIEILDEPRKHLCDLQMLLLSLGLLVRVTYIFELLWNESKSFVRESLRKSSRNIIFLYRVFFTK